MPTVLPSAALFVECQVALGMTQREFGALLGRDRRTIQRWQKGGVVLAAEEVSRLLAALQPVRPDLASRVADLARTHQRQTSVPLLVEPASPAIVAAILDAAASAASSTPAAMRAPVLAAFEAAAREDVPLAAIIAALETA